MEWEAVSGAETYKTELSKDINFNNIICRDSLIAETKKDIYELEDSTTYYWHVKAKSSLGESPWSDTWNFNTITTSVQGEHTIISDVSIYPNPLISGTEFILDITHNNYTKVNVTICNINGIFIEEIFNGYISPGRNIIKAKLNKNYPAGFYLVKILTDDGNVYIKPLIIIS